MKETTNMDLKLHFPKVKLLLDPQLMEDAFSMTVNGQLYRGLYRFTADGDVVPDLVESLTISPDKKTYTFTLKDQKYSNSRPITSDNVRMTFARMFNVGASMGADLHYIAGTDKFKKTKNINDLGIRALDPHHVEFDLSHPSPLFLIHLAVVDSSILPLNDFKSELIVNGGLGFSGPYKIVEQNEDHVTVEKWRADKFDSPQPPQKIIFTITDRDAATLANNSETDTLDHNIIPEKDAASLMTAGWKKVPTEIIEETFLVLNPKVVPDSVRRWFYLKTDPQKLAALSSDAKFNPAYGLIPTGLPGELSSKDVNGLKLSKNLVSPPTGEFEIEYDVINPFQERVAKFLQSEWSTPTLRVNLKPLTKAQKLDRIIHKKVGIAITQKGLDYPEGYSVITYFRSGYDANYFYVNDPKIDQQITKAAEETDNAKRTTLYRQTQLEILKHHTVIPLFFGSNASGLWSPRIKTVPPHPLGFHMLPLESLEMNRGT